MRPNLKKSGFTLLEILIAMFIFTFVAIIMTNALHNTLVLQAGVEKNSARITELQMAFTLLSRDIQQAIDRPITDVKGIPQPAFIGTPNQITFTHAGLANPFGGLKRATLQRTEYSASNSVLVRRSWPVLDPTPTTPSYSRNLLSQVTALQFEYLDPATHKFVNTWPQTQNIPHSPLPRAVRVSLTLEHRGKITQLYLIAGQAFAADFL